MKMKSKFKDHPCPICDRIIKKDATIVKVNEHWCIDENCKNNKSTQKLGVFESEKINKSSNTPDVDPELDRLARGVDKMFEICTAKAIEAIGRLEQNTQLSKFQDKEYGKKQIIIVFQVYLKGAFEYYNNHSL